MSGRLPEPVREKVAELLEIGWRAPDVIAMFERGIPDFPRRYSISERTVRRIAKEKFPDGVAAARAAYVERKRVKVGARG